MSEVIAGLNLINDGNNSVNVSDKTKFLRSSITVVGEGNSISIEQCRYIDGLNVVLKGNNKRFVLKSSSKKIRNLKVVSHRGDNQLVYIESQFGCGGCEIQMNDGGESLRIGSDCLFSWGIKIRTSDGHTIYDLSTGEVINKPSDVVIGDHVWISEDVKVLKGSLIPNNSVVGSSSIFTRKFSKENCIFAGSPARIVRENVNWDRENPVYFN